MTTKSLKEKCKNKVNGCNHLSAERSEYCLSCQIRQENKSLKEQIIELMPEERNLGRDKKGICLGCGNAVYTPCDCVGYNCALIDYKSKLPDIINLIREDTIERVKEAIDENITINQSTHRVGSHSDDYGGDNDLPCDCNKKERDCHITALRHLKIKLPTLSKGGEKE